MCRGLEVLGKIRDCQRFFLEKIGGSTEFSLESDAIILRRVCSPCPWREHECDYRDPSVEEANPCGGVVLLALLLDAGDITEEDLEDL